MKALILIGGKSKRLGTNKYLLDFHGVPQFRYLMSVLEKAGLDTYLSCNRIQNDKLPEELQTIVDTREDLGPKGGIMSAFEMYPDSAWLTIACDLPFVNGDNVMKLVKSRDMSCHATTYRASDDFYETTFTIYEPAAYKLMKDTLEKGDKSLQTVLKKSDIKVIRTINERDTFNVNNQEDLEIATELKEKILS